MRILFGILKLRELTEFVSKNRTMSLNQTSDSDAVQDYGKKDYEIHYKAI